MTDENTKNVKRRNYENIDEQGNKRFKFSVEPKPLPPIFALNEQETPFMLPERDPRIPMSNNKIIIYKHDHTDTLRYNACNDPSHEHNILDIIYTNVLPIRRP